MSEASAREWGAGQGRDAAFLFSYTLDRGHQEDFSAAYRDHLQWHVEHRDHLAWYGWFVTSGPHVGSFVDGTFGVTLDEYSRRPDLAEDGRHFAEHVAPFSQPRAYTQLEVWPEVSTAFSLEAWTPSRTLDVWTIEIEPSAQTAFEHALAEAAQRARPAAASLRWTWYRVVSGGRLASYLVFSPRNSITEATGDRSSLAKLASLAYGASPEALERLNANVASIESETWSYRADLSLFPEAR